MRGCIVWCIILAGAEGSAAISVSIGDQYAGGTQWRYPVPPVPAQEAAPLILCRVVITIAALALSQGCKGGSQSQRSRHSAENHGVKAALCGVHGGKFRKRGQFLFQSVEPTCAALSTTTKGRKAKERTSYRRTRGMRTTGA